MTAKLRALAAHTLTESGVTRLPVRLGDIARRLGVRLLTYRQYADIAEVTTEDVVRRFGADGFTLGGCGYPVVVYRDDGNPQRIRWTVAHELAHLLLGHLDGAEESCAAENEQQANALAAELLCPVALLDACGCGEPDGVARLCDVSLTAARVVRLHPDGGMTEDEERLLAACHEFVADRKRGASGEALPRLRRNRI